MTADKPTSFLFRWREAIYSSDLTSTERHVLHVLSFHGDEHGRNCFPSIVSLARKTGHGRKTCWLALQRGLAAGWITSAGRIMFDGSIAKGGRGQGNLSTVNYALAIPGTVVVVTTVSEAEREPSKQRTVVMESQTVVTDAETVVTTTPNLCSTSSKNSPSSRKRSVTVTAKDDDDASLLFKEAIRLETARRTDPRVESGDITSRRGYIATVAKNLALEDGDAIRAAIEANPDASALELLAIIWPEDDTRTAGARITPLAFEAFDEDRVPLWYDTDGRPVFVDPDDAVLAFAEAWVKHAEQTSTVRDVAAMKRWVIKKWGAWARERNESGRYRPTQLVDMAHALGASPPPVTDHAPVTVPDAAELEAVQADDVLDPVPTDAPTDDDHAPDTAELETSTVPEITPEDEAAKARAMEHHALLRASSTVTPTTAPTPEPAPIASAKPGRAGNGSRRQLDRAAIAAGLNREEMIAAAAQIVGRPLGSLKALTGVETGVVLAAFASKAAER